MSLDFNATNPTLDLTEMAKTVKRKINGATRDHFAEDEMRSHLGASVIGADCLRDVWYGWRWINDEELDGRQYRLFNRGHTEEDRFKLWLELAGFKVLSEQERISFGFGNHGGGSSDAIVMLPSDMGYDKPVLVEEKTHNDKSYKEYLKHGVHKSKPQHVRQANIYAHKLGIDLIIYLPVCKNDDAIDPEFFWVDHDLAEDDLRKADDVITRQSPPPRAFRRETHFKCTWCTHSATCWKGAGATEKNCRSCKFARPGPDKTWTCDKGQEGNNTIPKEFIPKGCAAWEDITNG